MKLNAIIFDFSRTLLFPKDTTYTGGLNKRYAEVKEKPNFVFTDYFTFNDELITYLESHQDAWTVHILSSKVIQDDPAVQKHIGHLFLNIYSALRIGKKKTDPELYRIVSEKINEQPGHVCYVDDKQKNLSAASSAGMMAIHYTNNTQLIADLKKL
ncbi:MAG: HAD-IA family hydrolase [Patescibacteria group bacterium]|jgi:HAD superfamily hydrolase (TIGR01509 family)